MTDERIFRARVELKQMGKAGLLNMTFSQKEKNCVLGGACPFLLEYRHILFCASEILGQGCQIEKLRVRPDQNAQADGEISQEIMESQVGPWLPDLG